MYFNCTKRFVDYFNLGEQSVRLTSSTLLIKKSHFNGDILEGYQIQSVPVTQTIQTNNS